MLKYLRYLKYIIRHKWFVFIACCKMGIIYRGIIHDLSKLLPSEFIPYARYFYGDKKGIKRGRDKTGYYKPYDTGDKDFDFAWLLHQKRNNHHWQWWILPLDDGGLKMIQMSDVAMKEMICDWQGAGMAISRRKDPLPWYEVNKDNIQLHPTTRKVLENKLNLISKKINSKK